ncbi:MAG: sugar ABC transporter ATP-binding protein [[Clostridium] scindens]
MGETYKCRDDVFLHAEKISKIYPGTKALDEVSFDLLRGKVNVLIGENGAGKSTLMKMIAGIEQPNEGKMYIGDKEVFFKNTTEARKHGIGIIHQELSLFPNLNVYQNIYMNKEKTKGKVVLDNKVHMDGAGKVLERLEHPLDLNAKVGELRVGQQQMIEIARNLVEDDLKVLIMDEPTSSLSQQEVKVLFKIMRELTAAGISIVYISHRLEEIMEIGDHVTILRDGKYVADADVKDIDVPWIVHQMTGGAKSYPKRDREVDWSKVENVLEVKDLCLPKAGGGYLVDHLNFELKKGEVLGIYGLMGAGRSEVFECLMGLHPEHTGQILMEGKELHIKSISQQIDSGFALIPEDRQMQGLVQTLDIERTARSPRLRDTRRGLSLTARKRPRKWIRKSRIYRSKWQIRNCRFFPCQVVTSRK